MRLGVLGCGLSFWEYIVSEGMVRQFGRLISQPINRSVDEIGVNSILVILLYFTPPVK